MVVFYNYILILCFVYIIIDSIKIQLNNNNKISLTPNILGYHSNYRYKVKGFLNKNELILSDDNEYLGKGMYFWDNLSNAKYSANKKIRDNQKVNNIQICKANIILTEPILDLTDSKSIKDIHNLWIYYCKKAKEEKTHQFLGTILDILFDFFPDFNEIKVSKCHGDYSRYKKSSFLEKLGTKARIDDRPRTIYSVRCNTRVKNREYFETVTR